MQKEITSDWYASWFDTPYYHILYKDRDNAEADSFMERLTSFLQLKQNDTILDLACGKGRHAISLSQDLTFRAWIYRHPAFNLQNNTSLRI